MHALEQQSSDFQPMRAQLPPGLGHRPSAWPIVAVCLPAHMSHKAWGSAERTETSWSWVHSATLLIAHNQHQKLPDLLVHMSGPEVPDRILLRTACPTS